MNVSTRHVFGILRLVCQSRWPVGSAEIQESLELPSSTIHRALASLEEEGFIARYRGASKYVIGPNPQHLAHALFSLFPLRQALHGRLRDAAVAGKQTLLLTMRVGWYGMKVAVFEGTSQVFHAGALGETRLLVDDAAGRSMLSAMAGDERKRMKDYFQVRWPGLAGQLQARMGLEDGNGGQPDGEGWLWRHVAIRDASGQVFASLSSGVAQEAALQSGGASADLGALASQVEALVAGQPELAWSPFGHLPADDLVLADPVPAGAGTGS